MRVMSTRVLLRAVEALKKHSIGEKKYVFLYASVVFIVKYKERTKGMPLSRLCVNDRLSDI